MFCIVKLGCFIGGFTMSAIETIYKISLISNRLNWGNSVLIYNKCCEMKCFINVLLNIYLKISENNGEKLFLIKWKSDLQLEIINGYQIEAIRHSEKKWYNSEKQMYVLREATKDDKNKYEIVI